MIVVDASLALKLVLREDDSMHAQSLWHQWEGAGEPLCAPALFRAETASVLRREIYRQHITEDEGRQGFETLQRLSIEIREPGGLYEVAWSYAERFNRSTVYDSCYLALAGIFGCELWTADRRLVNAANELPWVRLL
ncbi:MAG TPA: type II toxin-antitoxin system VapC family toxin [Dehalococcoidia bacterium]|nr:type II toxin-antitoxin system VapC family toxin [Dehalococcoidia bacterium]